MKTEEQKRGEIILYMAKHGPQVEVRLEGDTIWLSQAQIAELFGSERSVVTKHFKNIFTSGELDEKSNVQKMHIANSDKPVGFYSLDAVISVGYRVNSKQATEFRIWATGVLRDHITKGYTIHRKQIGKNYDAFMKSVADIQALLPEHVVLDPKNILELIKEFASTWVSLNAYDKETLTVIGTTKKAIALSGVELKEAIAALRTDLMQKGEATDIFAQEREKGSIEGIVGNVMQSFGGKSVYETAEEKAAHLLYFMVKNHPFTDGNKRSGAFAFV